MPKQDIEKKTFVIKTIIHWLNIEWHEGFKILRPAMVENVLDIQWMVMNLLLMFRWLENPHAKMCSNCFATEKNHIFEVWGIDYSKDGEFWRHHWCILYQWLLQKFNFKTTL